MKFKIFLVGEWLKMSLRLLYKQHCCRVCLWEMRSVSMCLTGVVQVWASINTGNHLTQSSSELTVSHHQPVSTLHSRHKTTVSRSTYLTILWRRHFLAIRPDVVDMTALLKWQRRPTNNTHRQQSYSPSQATLCWPTRPHSRPFLYSHSSLCHKTSDKASASRAVTQSTTTITTTTTIMNDYYYFHFNFITFLK